MMSQTSKTVLNMTTPTQEIKSYRDAEKIGNQQDSQEKAQFSFNCNNPQMNKISTQRPHIIRNHINKKVVRISLSPPPEKIPLPTKSQSYIMSLERRTIEKLKNQYKFIQIKVFNTQNQQIQVSQCNPSQSFQNLQVMLGYAIKLFGIPLTVKSGTSTKQPTKLCYQQISTSYQIPRIQIEVLIDEFVVTEQVIQKQQAIGKKSGKQYALKFDPIVQQNKSKEIENTFESVKIQSVQSAVPQAFVPAKYNPIITKKHVSFCLTSKEIPQLQFSEKAQIFEEENNKILPTEDKLLFVDDFIRDQQEQNQSEDCLSDWSQKSEVNRETFNQRISELTANNLQQFELMQMKVKTQVTEQRQENKFVDMKNNNLLIGLKKISELGMSQYSQSSKKRGIITSRNSMFFKMSDSLFSENKLAKIKMMKSTVTTSDNETKPQHHMMTLFSRSFNQ